MINSCINSTLCWKCLDIFINRECWEVWTGEYVFETCFKSVKSVLICIDCVFLWNIVLLLPFGTFLAQQATSQLKAKRQQEKRNFFQNEVLRCVSGHDCGLFLDASLLFKQLFIFNWDCLFWWNIDREAQVATFWNSSYRTYLGHHFFAHSLLFKNEKTRSGFTGRTHYHWPSLFNYLSFYLHYRQNVEKQILMYLTSFRSCCLMFRKLHNSLYQITNPFIFTFLTERTLWKVNILFLSA